MFSIGYFFKQFSILYRYISTKKVINFFKLTFSYLLSFCGYHKHFNTTPVFISVEAADYCNLHCPECPVGNGTGRKSNRTTFDYENYKLLIDELKTKLLHVILYFQGEPFLNKSLDLFINYAHKAKIYTSTSTNGHFITDKIAEKIVRSGLDKLIVSIDGTTQGIYETYRVGGDLKKPITSIERLVYWKQKLKSVTPLIEIQFIVFRTNEHQMDEMKLMTKRLKADKLTFKTAQIYDFEDGHELMTTINKYSRYKKGNNGKYKLKGNQPNRCLRLWNGAVVTSTGDVLPCCFDKSADYSFGNIGKDSFSNIMKNKKASGFRKEILNNRKQFEMCRNCTSK